MELAWNHPSISMQPVCHQKTCLNAHLGHRAPRARDEVWPVVAALAVPRRVRAPAAGAGSRVGVDAAGQLEEPAAVEARVCPEAGGRARRERQPVSSQGARVPRGAARCMRERSRVRARLACVVCGSRRRGSCARARARRESAARAFDPPACRTAIRLPIVRVACAVLGQALPLHVAHPRPVVHQEALAHALDGHELPIRRRAHPGHRPRQAEAGRGADRRASRAAEAAVGHEECLGRERSALARPAGHVGAGGALDGHARRQPHLPPSDARRHGSHGRRTRA